MNSSNFSRRRFLGTTAALAAGSIIPMSVQGSPASASKKDKQGSNFNGVQVGAITYSWRSMPGGLENIIKYCRQAGISSVELMSGDLEDFLGAPKRSGGIGQNYNQQVREWRTSFDFSKVQAAKALFDNAGIKVPIVKFSPSRWSDEEIDYAFRTAKAMGAKGVTDEIGEEPVKKLAPFAEKHGMFAIFHNHMQFATKGFSYDPFLAVSPAVMMNFDTGHFFGSTGIHPNTILEKYHSRIFSIHMKDKTGPQTSPANANQVWGQGESPISDILLLIKKNKWPIYCDIELEYEVKSWSDAVKQTKLCVDFARQILQNG